MSKPSKKKAGRKGTAVVVDGGEVVVSRPMQTRQGFTIVTTDYVDFTNDHNQRKLKHPYAQDLPLYRSDTPDSESMFRVFSSDRNALKYIERFLKADDYRVVPVILSAKLHTPKKGKK